jgi:Zn-dependent protease
MARGVRLGRIAGIEVSASWSLLVIVGLITWALGGSVLPAAAPAAPAVAVWTVAAVGAVTFFACVLAHELAHSLVATASGMAIDGITLWVFGGVSRLRTEPPDARTEVRLALAGPLASLALGAGFGGLALLLAAVRAPEIVVAVVAWLAAVNTVLALFNLLSAFPLDGGRVLRGVLWRRSGDLRRATEVASACGTAVGYGLVALGAGLVLAGAPLSGVWMALLGWIVIEAARAEQGGAALHRLLGATRVADIMTPDPVTVPADLSVDALIRHHVASCRCSAFPVTGPDGSPSGLVALSRLREVPAHLRATTPVAAVAIPLDRVVAAHPDDLVVDLLARLTPASGRRALVLGPGGELVGIVTAAEVERALEVATVAGAGSLAGTGR